MNKQVDKLDLFDVYISEIDRDDEKTFRSNVSIFESYLESNKEQFNLDEISRNKFFVLNMKKISTAASFLSEWESFNEDLLEQPRITLKILSVAMHKLILKNLDPEKPQFGLTKLKCRLEFYEPVLQLKYLRSNVYGKMLSIRGTIIKASAITRRCGEVEFECRVCNGTQIAKQADGLFTTPKSCKTKGCRVTGRFQPLLMSARTQTTPIQCLKVQELLGDDLEDNARMPRSIDCEIYDDLVGTCIPGDEVILTGILYAKNTNNEKYFRKRARVQQSIYQQLMKVNNVQNERTRRQSMLLNNVKDLRLIEKVRNEENLFRFLVQSLCPQIYGHDVIKAGLLLALFGGTKDNAFHRSESHVLVVGDPGLGKSRLLQACCDVSPRSVYVCGTASTNAGLTVTMSKESSGEYRLEAGALIQADQGCCCIDEFDKMHQHACLLEVMEQQSISIAKAGVTCSIPTRVSVLATANPVSGHYNKARTVSENLKMSSPLLSRFDLVFIILDTADEELDAFVSDHVLAKHFGQNSPCSTASSGKSSKPAHNTTNGDDLKSRLALQPGEQIAHLPPLLFKKYIEHAKKSIHPRLTPEAQQIIANFYIELRSQQTQDGMPVTTRQLVSLKRLTEARAKLELRDLATDKDAIDVVEIMKHSLMDTFSDDIGLIDFSRTQNGAGVSNRKQVTQFLNVVKLHCERIQTNYLSRKDLKTIAANLGITGAKFNDILESVNIQGYMLKKGNGRYEIIISE